MAKPKVVVPAEIDLLSSIHNDDSPIQVRCAESAVNQLCSYLGESDKAKVVAQLKKEINYDV